MQAYFFILYFFTYGFLGWCTEVAYATTRQKRFVNRGFLNGPICPIYGVGVGVVVQFLMPLQNQVILLYIAATVLVTVIEGITGYLMDKIFHHKWWDYSNQPLNIGGYVCVIFSLAWGVACVIIVKVIQPLIHHVLAWIPTMAGIVIIVILGVILFVDLYVTASGIFKLNRRLESMDRIAAELRELSDKVGENIHEGVMETLKRQEELKEHYDDFKEHYDDFKEHYDDFKEQHGDLRDHYEELRERYEELASRTNSVGKRLMKAFPKMESRRHKNILEELKQRIKKEK